MKLPMKEKTRRRVEHFLCHRKGVIVIRKGSPNSVNGFNKILSEAQAAWGALPNGATRLPLFAAAQHALSVLPD